jgi:hypothetical protein
MYHPTLSQGDAFYKLPNTNLRIEASAEKIDGSCISRQRVFVNVKRVWRYWRHTWLLIVIFETDRLEDRDDPLFGSFQLPRTILSVAVFILRRMP